MTTTTTTKLTKPQQAILRQIREDRWTPGKALGSETTIWHLIRKGYVEARSVRGPRGGEQFEYRTLPMAARIAGWTVRSFTAAAPEVCDCGCGTILDRGYGLRRHMVPNVRYCDIPADPAERVAVIRYAVDADHAAVADSLHGSVRP